MPRETVTVTIKAEYYDRVRTELLGLGNLLNAFENDMSGNYVITLLVNDVNIFLEWIKLYNPKFLKIERAERVNNEELSRKVRDITQEEFEISLKRTVEGVESPRIKNFLRRNYFYGENGILTKEVVLALVTSTTKEELEEKKAIKDLSLRGLGDIMLSGIHRVIEAILTEAEE